MTPPLPTDTGQTKMTKAVSFRHRAKQRFEARYERDNVSDMSREEWGEWVNKLPLEEFMAMIDLYSPATSKPRRKSRKSTGKHKDLCVRLVAIAAFQIKDKQAQAAVYKAVKELSRI